MKKILFICSLLLQYTYCLFAENNWRTHFSYNRVQQIAIDNNIEIRKDEDLLQILKAVDINEEIPVEAFAAVAEIISYIYQQNGKELNKNTNKYQNPNTVLPYHGSQTVGDKLHCREGDSPDRRLRSPIWI